MCRPFAATRLRDSGEDGFLSVETLGLECRPSWPIFGQPSASRRKRVFVLALAPEGKART